MGRGLSQLQKRILGVLPQFSEDTSWRDLRDGGLSVAEVMAELGLDRTEANRVTVSRALSRLMARRLVEATYGFWQPGRLRASPVYFIPDEALLNRIEAERAAFRQKYGMD